MRDVLAGQRLATGAAYGGDGVNTFALPDLRGRLPIGMGRGVGLSNYNAADLLRIRGLKRHEVAAILGDAHYPEVVHRDNLLLDAAL